MTPFWIIALTLFVQVAATVVVFRHCRRKRSVGFPLLYLLNLAVMHGGTFVYLLPQYNPANDLYLLSYAMTPHTVPLGCCATALGTVAMVMGILFYKHLFSGTVARFREQPRDERFAKFVANMLLLIGVPCFFATYVLKNVGLDAVFLAGQNCAVLGLILHVYRNVQRKRPYLAMLAMFGYSMLPAYYFFFQGFLSYGFQYFLLLACVIGCNVEYSRKRAAWIAILVPLIAYMLVSASVVYLENRRDLRAVLWSDATLGRRISVSLATINRFHLLDPFDNSQLALIDSRFNQNIFVGKAIEYLDRNPNSFGNGETIRDAVLAFVPRMFWRNKPIIGGTEMLSRYTGMKFSKTVTMQIGLILEAYVNFGWLGIFVLLFVYGCIIEFVDTRATMYFHRRQLADFVPYFLVGMTLAWPGASLTAQIAGITAILVLTVPLRLVLDFEMRRHRKSAFRAVPLQRVR
jgi:hypothetical protein